MTRGVALRRRDAAADTMSEERFIVTCECGARFWEPNGCPVCALTASRKHEGDGCDETTSCDSSPKPDVQESPRCTTSPTPQRPSRSHAASTSARSAPNVWPTSNRTSRTLMGLLAASIGEQGNGFPMSESDFYRHLNARNAAHRTAMRSIGEAASRRARDAAGLSPDRRLRLDAPYPATDGTQQCATFDLSMFFEWATKESEAICHGCPFLEPCFLFALTHNVPGVWAGTTEGFRRLERQRLHLEAINLEAMAG